MAYSEWVFRSFLRWGRQIGLEELKRLQAEGIAKHVEGGGRLLVSTAHGGKQSTWTFPAELGIASLREILEKVIWLMDNFSEIELDNYQRNYPSSVAHGRFGQWIP